MSGDCIVAVANGLRVPALIICSWPLAHLYAQNVTNYQAMPDPTLLLLREPAVLDELKLSREQRTALDAFNVRLDGPLLASRNRPLEEQSQQTERWIGETREQLRSVLSGEQLERFDQLTIRVRGLRSLLSPAVAQQIQLTSSQTQQIEAAFDDLQQRVAALQKRAAEGAPADSLTRQANEQHERAQQQVFEVLSLPQRSRFVQLIGRTFDLKQLGHARFKAPELAVSDHWINSAPLQLSELRGSVVALHFWTFGCINCQRNFPWYRTWHQTFDQQRLTIVGVHTPETAPEAVVDEVRDRVGQIGFQFPIVVDNDRRIWNSWGNSMWPSVYLIDKQGYVRYWWYGELNWQGAEGEEIMRRKIEELLAEPSS